MCNCTKIRAELVQAIKDRDIGKTIRTAAAGAKEITAPAVARLSARIIRR